jgi:hypothetical protein
MVRPIGKMKYGIADQQIEISIFKREIFH